MALVSLDEADAFLRDFATRHGIRRLALFGSVLRG
jgi:predicted nucleotidyltransferase